MLRASSIKGGVLASTNVIELPPMLGGLPASQDVKTTPVYLGIVDETEQADDDKIRVCEYLYYMYTFPMTLDFHHAVCAATTRFTGAIRNSGHRNVTSNRLVLGLELTVSAHSSKSLSLKLDETTKQT
jgi:hypothetical protein